MIGAIEEASKKPRPWRKSDHGNTIHVDIVSAEGQIFSGEASMVFVRARKVNSASPRHAPLLTTLKAGEVRVQSRGTRNSRSMSAGAPSKFSRIW